VIPRVGNREEAEDLTQAFFAHLLERRLPARADRQRGRFRSFLLTALKHFLANERDRARAQRRGGGVQRVSETVIDSLADSETDPEQIFEREWARTVLREALRRLEEEASEAGRAEQFTKLRQFLTESPGDGEYDAVAKELKLRRNTVAVAVHRMRARLQELVREVLADTGGDAADIENELRRMRGTLADRRGT
jgi:RNA polymerase sigma-70 factor (ECF subfamily)